MFKKELMWGAKTKMEIVIEGVKYTRIYFKTCDFLMEVLFNNDKLRIADVYDLKSTTWTFSELVENGEKMLKNGTRRNIIYNSIIDNDEWLQIEIELHRQFKKYSPSLLKKYFQE